MNTYTPNSSKIVHYTFADFSLRQVTRPIHIVQYDDSIPILAVKLYNDGQVYKIPPSANCNIRLRKPDGKFVYNPALGCDSAREVAYFEITRQMAVLSGEVSPVVEIEMDGDYVATSSIGIVIDRNPIQQRAIESSNEYITAKEYAKDAVDAAARALASRDAAKTSENNAKTSASNASAYANQAKTSASNAKTSEENADNSSTSASSSANLAKTSENNAKTSANNAKASETSALDYANQAKAALEEIIGADIGNFGKQLSEQHSVLQPVYDSSGELMIDSNNEHLESQTIFAVFEDVLQLRKTVSALESILMEFIGCSLAQRVGKNETTIGALEKYALLDSLY